jgi:hypothetical protein
MTCANELAPLSSAREQSIDQLVTLLLRNERDGKEIKLSDMPWTRKVLYLKLLHERSKLLTIVSPRESIQLQESTILIIFTLVNGMEKIAMRLVIGLSHHDFPWLENHRQMLE